MLLAVVQHDAGLEHRGGGYDVARTATTLVSNVTDEIIPFEVFPGEFRWKLVFADFFWIFEVGLGSLECFVELSRAVVEQISFGANLREGYLFWQVDVAGSRP